MITDLSTIQDNVRPTSLQKPSHYNSPLGWPGINILKISKRNIETFSVRLCRYRTEGGAELLYLGGTLGGVVS